jgi:putative phosphoesterase
MRFAVLADIHGNLPALQAILQDADKERVDGFILAGDYFAGPQGSQTTRLLHSLRGWKISGNGEVNLRREARGEAPPSWWSYKQFALHRWLAGQMSPVDWEFVHSLPEQQVIDLPGAAPVRVVHGSHRSPFEEIHPEEPASALEAVLAETSEAVFICGHTHLPWIVRRDGRLALNPGAVCGPLDGFVGAEYALLSWDGSRWQAELRAVPYDIAAVRRAFRESGLLHEGGALARAFLASIETGQNIGRGFLDYAFRLAAQAGDANCLFVPDTIWDEAARTFCWPGS